MSLELIKKIAVDWWWHTGFNGTFIQQEIGNKYYPNGFLDFENNVCDIFIKEILYCLDYKQLSNTELANLWWNELNKEYCDYLLHEYGMYDIYYHHDIGFTEEHLLALFEEHFNLNENVKVKQLQKLILHHHYGTCEGDCGDYVIPFEYESIEKFILDVIDGKINLYDTFNISETIDEISNSFYTLDEWFKTNNHKIN